MRSLLLAVALYAPLTYAGIRVSDELPIADPRPAASVSNPNPYVTASDGSRFLVVWNDTAGLRATIVDDQGRAPTAVPTLIAPTVGNSINASAVWTGSAYLITWTAYAGTQPRAYAAMVSADGLLLRQPYVFATNAITSTSGLAHVPQRSMQYYQRADTPLIATFDDSGNVIAADVPLALNGFAGAFYAQLASTGSNLALAWRTYDALGKQDVLRVQRLLIDGTTVGPPVTFETPYAGAAAIAGGNGKFAAVTTAMQKVGGNFQPIVVRFIIDAATGTSTALPPVPAAGGGDNVIWTGREFIAYGSGLANDARDTIVTVAFSGEPESAPPGAVKLHTGDAQIGTPLLTASGTNVLAVWQRQYDNPGPLRSALVDAHATAFATQPSFFLVSWSRQLEPAIATSGDESLVVWTERTSDSTGDILARRVTANGSPLDPEPFFLSKTIEIPAYTFGLNRVRVTYTGSVYIVAWSASRNPESPSMVLRTVTREGVMGPPVQLPGYVDAMVSNPTLTLLVAYSSTGMVAYRIAPSGEVIDQVPVATRPARYPSIATNGSEFFVAWDEGHMPTILDQWSMPPWVDVYGLRVYPSGAVDAAPIAIATGDPNQFLGAVASDGRDFVVFYNYSGFNLYALTAKRVVREGQLSGFTTEEPGTVVWNEDTYNTLPTTEDSMAAVGDPAGGYWVAWPGFDRIMLVHTDRNANRDQAFVLAQGFEAIEYHDANVALASSPSGPLRVAYSRPVTEGPFAGTKQVFVRVVGTSTAGPRLRAVRP